MNSDLESDGTCLWVVSLYLDTSWRGSWSLMKMICFQNVISFRPVIYVLLEGLRFVGLVWSGHIANAVQLFNHCHPAAPLPPSCLTVCPPHQPPVPGTCPSRSALDFGWFCWDPLPGVAAGFHCQLTQLELHSLGKVFLKGSRMSCGYIFAWLSWLC